MSRTGCVWAIVLGLSMGTTWVRAEPGAANEPIITLDEVLVTGLADERSIYDTPYSTQRIGSVESFERSYRTLPQMLRNVPAVMVQETGAGQGSPYIRGFTGQQTLLLIDGVRLNNSVFRSGPNQYWNTIDAMSLDRLEVVKGPSSVLYGSDAIGGTVQAFTVEPYGYASTQPVSGRAVFRYASAERSFQQRGEVSVTHDQTFGLIAGLSGKLYGDLQTGGGTQAEVAYDEYDADFKGEWWLDDNARLVLAHQRVRQNNVPRTHKTAFALPFEGTTVGTELQRDLDQSRELTYLQLHAERLDGWVESVHAGVSHQRQTEVRHRMRTARPDDFQGFGVDTLGVFLRAQSDTPIGRLSYGAEYYHDDVESFSSSNPVQGPVADDATYDLLGVYLQSEIELDERTLLVLGGRFTYAAVNADRVSDPVSGLPISLSDHWTNVVGSARLLHELEPDRVNLFGGVSQGFRAPNLSDLTRFDTARTDEFEIPAPGLEPEHFITFEMGGRLRDDDLAIELSGYYTLIDDMILRVPTGVVDDSGTPADPSDDLFQVTKSNVGDGYLYGVELSASQRLEHSLTVFGNVAYIEGQVSTFPTSAPIADEEFIDRLMPLTGQVGVRWDDADRDLWIEGLVRMAARADRLSTRDASDTSRIPPGGTPGYAVFDVAMGGTFQEDVHYRLGVDNVFDTNYRVHGSGQNMPGISVIFAVEILH